MAEIFQQIKAKGSGEWVSEHISLHCKLRQEEA
jgi:hypothetical protein